MPLDQSQPIADPSLGDIGLARIVPDGLSLVETWNRVSPDDLLPAEAESLGRASEKRRGDFAAGRVCARRALQRLGVDPQPILRGPNRQPIWPPGVIGSITHTDGHAAAAVGWRADGRSVGIDAEPRRPLAPGVLGMISVPSERRWISDAADGLPWDLVLFSAKESIFKAWFPIAGTWLGFDEAEVTFDPPAGAFHARLRPGVRADAQAPRQAHGRFHVGPTHLFTCAVMALGSADAR